QGVGHQVLLGGPAAVDGGLAGLGRGGDALHGQAVPSDRTQLVEGGVEDRALQDRATTTGTGGPGLGLGPARSVHLTLSNEQWKRAFRGWGARRAASTGGGHAGRRRVE